MSGRVQSEGGTSGPAPERDDFLTIPRLIDFARERLGRDRRDWLEGGAESEVTLERNRLAFGDWALRARVLRDVREIDCSAAWLDGRIDLPVIAAPVGLLGDFHADGACAVGRAMAEVGSVPCVGALGEGDLASVAPAGSAPPVLQIYAAPGKRWVEAAVRSAEAAGFGAICLTVDTPVYGRRERDLENGFRLPPPPVDPTFSADPAAEQAGVTWDYVDWLRSISRLPICLKGIRLPEDALLAIEHGVEVVWLSNHGGRQLDHEPATLTLLPEVVDAVGGRARVVFDGGVQRGSDVIKALALGADLVAVGKLQLWGLAAGGCAGLVRAFGLLKEELRVSLGNMGIRTLSELNREVLRPTSRVRAV